MLIEIGRMLSQFGERELACRFYRESEDVITPQHTVRGVAWFPADLKLVRDSHNIIV